MADKRPLTVSDGKVAEMPVGDRLTGPFVLPYYNINSDTNLSTSSTTDVLLVGTEITPVAGTYLVTAHCFVNNNSNNAGIAVSLYVAGTQVSGSERQFYRGGNQFNQVRFTYAICIPITFNGAQTINMRFRRLSRGTATSYYRDITLLRVG